MKLKNIVNIIRSALEQEERKKSERFKLLRLAQKKLKKRDRQLHERLEAAVTEEEREKIRDKIGVTGKHRRKAIEALRELSDDKG
jgi:hypothetical protein